ncbi:hypothetical protein J6590_028095 [Homalodisca vitripennis]|nr:hypothetical protein J6590_028095 [Homalodisca vitripennis]
MIPGVNSEIVSHTRRCIKRKYLSQQRRFFFRDHETYVTVRIENFLSTNTSVVPSREDWSERSKTLPLSELELLMALTENVAGTEIAGWSLRILIPVFQTEVKVNKEFSCENLRLVIKEQDRVLGEFGNHEHDRASSMTEHQPFCEIPTYESSGDVLRSGRLPVIRGVPQGSVLEPILYILFTNGLPTFLENYTNSIMYAGDTVLLSAQKDVEQLEINSYITFNMAQQYCRYNDLHNTRHGQDFPLPLHRTALFEKKPTYAGKKFFNALPEEIKNNQDNL